MRRTSLTGGAMHTMQRHFNWFIGLLIISLVGNSCANFGVLWFCVAQITSGNASANTSHSVAAFYSGQATGAIFLAPALSAWADRHGRRCASVTLDLAYAAVLACMLLINFSGALSPTILFPFGAITAALGAVHRGAISYGAIKVASEQLHLTKLVAHYSVASSYITHLLGVLISGLLYQQLGLNGCLLVGIATFLPMPFIYYKIFPAEICPTRRAEERAIFSEITVGLAFMVGDWRLWANTLVISIWNVAAYIFPGIVAIAFQITNPGNTQYASSAVAVALVAGAIAFVPMERVAKKIPLHRMMFYALGPAMLALLLCVIAPSPFVMAFAFVLHCVGGALINIFSGALRVACVPPALTGRVNTAHAALIAVGQVIGSVVLIPLVSTNLAWSAALVLLTYVISATLAHRLFPSVRLADAM